MKKPFMLISVLPMTAHISNDADTAGDRTGGCQKNMRLRIKY